MGGKVATGLRTGSVCRLCNDAETDDEGRERAEGQLSWGRPPHGEPLTKAPRESYRVVLRYLAGCQSEATQLPCSRLVGDETVAQRQLKASRKSTEATRILGILG